jgi:DnaJ domain
MKNYYEILGVERSATQDEIKKVYRKLSIKFHPDKNPNDNFFEDRFKEINKAYSILSDEGKRTEYNEEYDSFVKLHTNFRQAEEHLRNEAEKVKFAKEKLKEEYEQLKKEQEVKYATKISADPVEKKASEKVEDSSNDWTILGIILLFIISFAVIIVFLPKREESNSTENIETVSNDIVDYSATVVDSAIATADSVKPVRHSKLRIDINTPLLPTPKKDKTYGGINLGEGSQYDKGLSSNIVEDGLLEDYRRERRMQEIKDNIGWDDF